MVSFPLANKDSLFFKKYRLLFQEYCHSTTTCLPPFIRTYLTEYHLICQIISKTFGK